MSTRNKQKHGSILVTMLFMMSVLALLVAAVANDSFQSMKTVSQSGRDTQAKYAAYAGLERALNELRKDERFAGFEEISERHGRMTKELQGFEHLKYDVLLWNNIQQRSADGTPSGDTPEDLAGPGDVIVRPDTVYLISSGENLHQGEEVILSSMAGTARRIRPVFEDAAYARTKLFLSGSDSLIDAWDSYGGTEAYAKGAFPGSSASTDDDQHPTVKNYRATLGTDSAGGRTMRLLNGAKLNGHYRVGPGADPDSAYGPDSGASSGVDSPTFFAVSTAQSDDQIAGVEPESEGSTSLSAKKVVVDSKTTEVPNFISPYDDDDVAGPPTLNNPTRPRLRHNGDPVLDWDGNPIIDPPEAVELAPGGYASVDVPWNQTLALTSGVYYFRDELSVKGTITTSGGGPVIIFCGKKAKFIDAKVNENRAAAKLQLCFTDDLKDEAELETVAARLQDILESTTASPFGDSVPVPGTESILNQISPLVNPAEPAREGFGLLEISGNTKFYGSVSGQNLVAFMNGGDFYGSIMGNIIKGENTKIHQDLSLKGSNLMTSGGWAIEGVHQIR